VSLVDVLGDGLTDTDWHLKAACHPRNQPNAQSEWFIPAALPARRPGKGTLIRLAQDRKRALQLCEGCPVRRDCGLWSRSADINFGVWGGRFLGKGPDDQDKRLWGDT